MNKPCLVKTCPAFADTKSILGYCPIHNSVATDSNMFDQALKGRLTAFLKEFAKDLDRGIYPRSF